MEDAEPVSYTHLDVYKRQALQGHGGRDVRDDQRGRLSPSVVLKR